MSTPVEKPKYQWGKRPEEQPYYDYNPPAKPMFLEEALMEFPDSNSIPRPESSQPLARLENITSYITTRHHEQRHRLLERHAADYKKWAAENELDIDRSYFRVDHHPSNFATGLCVNSFELIKSSAAKQALARLPAEHRNVLISTEQLKITLPEGPSGVQDRNLRTIEYAAMLGAWGVEERRQMLNEEQEMRMYHVEAMHLLYSALMRTAPEKYSKPELERRQSASSALGGPVPQPDPKPGSSAVQGTGTSPGAGTSGHAPKGPAKNPPGVATDPRLIPRDPRLR